jgi:rubrerythrin
MTDRRKVIDELERCVEHIRYSNFEKIPFWGNCQIAMMDSIALLKEHEPKTGKWILDDDDANSWECSECGGLLMINDGTPHENDWHFCPYCGAKLDKQEMKWE